MALKSALKRIKLNESTISMLLGALVIIVVGIAAINLFGNDNAGETIPALETQDIANENAGAENLPATHTVQEGEDLWKISQQYYNSGYRWVEIAEANNITDPNQLEQGQEITIPDLDVAGVEATPTTGQIAQATITETQPTATMTPEPTETVEPTVTESPDDSDEDQNQPEAEIEIQEDSYTVVQGDTLWSIAQKAYGDPYRWVDIAEANDLINPNLIHPGNTFTLPR